jgi:hypothetical protein
MRHKAVGNSINAAQASGSERADEQGSQNMDALLHILKFELTDEYQHQQLVAQAQQQHRGIDLRWLQLCMNQLRERCDMCRSFAQCLCDYLASPQGDVVTTNMSFRDCTPQLDTVLNYAQSMEQQAVQVRRMVKVMRARCAAEWELNPDREPIDLSWLQLRGGERR